MNIGFMLIFFPIGTIMKRISSNYKEQINGSLAFETQTDLDMR
jgi:hypothetical protein